MRIPRVITGVNIPFLRKSTYQENTFKREHIPTGIELRAPKKVIPTEKINYFA